MNHSWVSQKSGGLYHLEDEERFDVHGGKFTAFCGATGLFRSVRVDDGLIEFKKCEACLKFEVADQGKALQQGIDSLRVGDGGGSAKANPRGSSAAESLPVHPSGDTEGGDSGHGSPLSRFENSVNHFMKFVDEGIAR